MTTGSVGVFLIYFMKFITRTVFIHTLGKSYLGINGLFGNILDLLSLAELGVGQALAYRLYKPLVHGDTKRVTMLMQFYKKAYVIIGSVILFLGVAMIPMLKYLIKDLQSLTELGINITIVFLLFLLQSVTSYWFFAYKSAIVIADQKEYYLNVAAYGTSILTYGAQIFILIYYQNFLLYVGVIVLFNILQNLLYAKIANRLYSYINEAPDHKLPKEEQLDILKDCGSLFIYKINGVVLKATDNIVLSAFIGIGIVGLYSNYLLIYATIRTILYRVFRSAKASIGNLYANSSNKEKYDFFKALNLLTVVVYGTAGIGVILVADELIQIWIGSSYVISKPFSLLIGIELYTLGLKNNLDQVRSVMGLFRQAKWRPLAGIVVNLGVSIFLVSRIGIFGVIIGTLAADWLTFMVYDPRIIYMYGFKSYKSVWEYYKKNIQYLLQLAIICTLLKFVADSIPLEMNWMLILVKILLIGIATPVIMALMNYKRKEFKYLAGIVLKKDNRWRKLWKR